MKKLHFIVFFLIMTNVNAQQKQDSYLITYTGQFNSLFNRGEDFRPYQAWLYIQGDQSLFTMKPLHQNSEQNNMMSIDLILDSMFTVYKDVESNSLLLEPFVLRPSLNSKGVNILPGMIHQYKYQTVRGN